MVLSGGWDGLVNIWDLREGKPVGSIYGPVICGDGIDTYEDNILTASYASSNQLQTWKMTYFNATIDWDPMKTTNEPCLLYRYALLLLIFFFKIKLSGDTKKKRPPYDIVRYYIKQNY